LQFAVANANFATFGNPGGGMGDLSDRREARRFSMNLPVRVLVNDANGPELKANTRDVSYRGLYFVVEAPFEKDSEIDFILTLPQQIISAGDVNIRCHGRIVRVETDDHGKTGIAAKIEKYEFIPARASAA
jgi:hypothetical protein